MKTKTTLFALLLLAAPATAVAADLNKPYTLSQGEVIAADMATLFDAMRASDNFGSVPPATITYDKKSGKIEVKVFGTKASVDAAKKELDDFWKRFFDPLTYRAELQFGVKLEDDDFRLHYLNRSADYSEVLKRENGKILLP